MITDDQAASAVDDPDDDETDDDGLLHRVKAWFRADREHSAEWRKDAKEDFDFVAGHQWSEEDQQTLKEQMRPVITFNRIAPTIESVVGLEIGNRREVQYIPRTQGDAKADEILTAAGEWVRDQTEAEDEESDAFHDCVVSGMGWIDTRMDHEDDPEGKVVMERIDPLQMFWDATARKRNLIDARRVIRVQTDMDIEDARAMFPGFDDTELNASWADGKSNDTDHKADPIFAYEQDAGEPDKAPKTVTIVHVQWWEREAFHRIADPFTRQVADKTPDDHDLLKYRMGKLGMPLKSAKLTRKVYYQAFVGSVVLETGESPCDDSFSWQCITGKRDHNKGTFYGLVRTMKDPQRWANKWLSQSLHILNTNAKGGIMAERGAFENQRDAEDSYARSDRITWVEDGRIGGIVPKQAANFPAGFENLMQFAISSIRDTSGVNLELLGLKDQEQAGVLEAQRKQAGMTILAMLFDSLRRYRKRQGKVMLFFITTYLSDGRLIRIVGDKGAQYVPLIRQQGLAEYDVIVDDAPTAPNQKERVWEIIMSLMPTIGGMLTPDDLLALAEYSPLPTSVIEKLKQASQQKQQAQQPVQQMQQQMAVGKFQSDQAESAAKVAKDNAQADLAQVKAAKELVTPIAAPMPRFPASARRQ